MDHPEKQLIFACLVKNAPDLIIRARSWFMAYDREADFAIAHWEEHRKLPAPEAMDHLFPDFSKTKITEPPQFYFETLRKMRKTAEFQKFLEAGEKILRGKPSPEEIEEFLAGAPVGEGQQILEHWSSRQERIQAYTDRTKKADLVGGCPWPTLQRAMGGLRRGQFVAVIARMKTGKTFLTLKWLHHCWEQHDVPSLVISGEMTIEEMRGRLDCIDARIDARKYDEGDLSPADVKSLYRALKRREKKKETIHFNEKLTYNFSDVQAALAMSECPIVFLDGAYLFQVGNSRSEVEKMLHLSRGCKRLARRFNVALIATFQANRASEGKEAEGGVMASWSDAVRADADNALEIGVADRKSPRRWINLDVSRSRSTAGARFMVNYLPSPNCNFDEIPEFIHFMPKDTPDDESGK